MLKLEVIGESIVLLRKAQGLIQEQVALFSNLSLSRLQDIEHGCPNTTVDTLIRIAQTLGIDSRVLDVFSKPDRELLLAIRRPAPPAKQTGCALQVCRNIVLLRKEEGLSQKQLACMSNVSVSHLRNIEHGCANVTVKRLASIAEAFGMSLTELTWHSIPEAELLDLVEQARAAAGILYV